MGLDKKYCYRVGDFIQRTCHNSCPNLDCDADFIRIRGFGNESDTDSTEILVHPSCIDSVSFICKSCNNRFENSLRACNRSSTWNKQEITNDSVCMACDEIIQTISSYDEFIRASDNGIRFRDYKGNDYKINISLEKV